MLPLQRTVLVADALPLDSTKEQVVASTTSARRLLTETPIRKGPDTPFGDAGTLVQIQRAVVYEV